jgi:hypothetical protein
MNRTKFHVYTFVGSFPWCLGLAYVGQRLGLELMSEHSPLKAFMHKFDAVIGAAIILAAVWFVRSRIKTLKAYREADAAKAEKKSEVNGVSLEKKEAAKKEPAKSETGADA